jgi:hypothetical protein
VWWRLEPGRAKRKGPFPGGKRVGSWEKKKVKEKVKVKVKVKVKE